MKKMFIYLVCFFVTGSVSTQINPAKYWSVSFTKSFESVDKRLITANNNPKFKVGIYQLAFRAEFCAVSEPLFKLNLGFGISSQLDTWRRTFNHGFKKEGPIPYINYVTDRYYKGLIQAPVIGSISIYKNLHFTTEILPQISALTLASNAAYTLPQVIESWLRLDFHSIELNPGISLNLKRFDFRVIARVFQIKKVDKIIDQRRDAPIFESYNPLKIGFHIAYRV